MARNPYHLADYSKFRLPGSDQSGERLLPLNDASPSPVRCPNLSHHTSLALSFLALNIVILWWTPMLRALVDFLRFDCLGGDVMWTSTLLDFRLGVCVPQVLLTDHEPPDCDLRVRMRSESP